MTEVVEETLKGEFEGVRVREERDRVLERRRTIQLPLVLPR